MQLFELSSAIDYNGGCRARRRVLVVQFGLPGSSLGTGRAWQYGNASPLSPALEISWIFSAAWFFWSGAGLFASLHWCSAKSPGPTTLPGRLHSTCNIFAICVVQGCPLCSTGHKYHSHSLVRLWANWLRFEFVSSYPTAGPLAWQYPIPGVV